MAAQICVDQNVDIRYSLRMLSVPIDGPSRLFEDNQSVITSSTVPHSALNKRHNMLAYYIVKEATVAGFIMFSFLSGRYNLTDVLLKLMNCAWLRPIIQPMFFWEGDMFKALVPKEALD